MKITKKNVGILQTLEIVAKILFACPVVVFSASVRLNVDVDEENEMNLKLLKWWCGC